MKKLLGLIDCDDSVILEYCQLKNLEVEEVTNTWHFTFSFEKPVPVIRYRYFIDHLKKIPLLLDSVRTVTFQVEYEIASDDDLMDYYDYVIDILIDEDRRMMPLKDYPTDVRDNVIHVLVPYGAKSAFTTLYI